MKLRIVFISIICAVALGLIACTGILFFSQNKFFSELPSGYNDVLIYGSASSSLATPPLSPDSNDDRVVGEFNEFKNALNNTSFRLIESFLSGRWVGETKFDVDGDGERIKMRHDGLKSLQASTNQFMVELFWGTGNVQQIKVEGTELNFDTIRFVFGNQGDLSIVKVYAYKYADFFGSNSLALEDSIINPFSVYANTSALYSTVEDIISRV